MTTTILLENLLKIERSIGYADNLAVRAMLMEAQSQVLQVQAEMVKTLREMQLQRQKYERCAASALSPVSARFENRVVLAAGATVPPFIQKIA
jgi:hypothetical protein